MNIPETNLPRIVVVGGGFGGLQFAKQISEKHYQVVLIDRHNYHCFLPLLYQVATSGLEPDSIAYPIRKTFKDRNNFFFRVGEVMDIDEKMNMIHTSTGDIKYDHLVLATGSATNFFGNKDLEKNAFGMKSLTEALDLRSVILQSFEEALLAKTITEREALMNFVIVGAGPTGTELAGALAELKNHVLPRDYPDLDFRQMNIHLIEAAPRVLAAMSEKSSANAYKFLEGLGVKIWVDTMVASYDGTVVQTANGTELMSKTLIWAAGVMGNPVDGIKAENVQRNGRIKVDEFNQVIGTENIYAIGDVAAMISEKFPVGHPMMAQPAIQQGANLAKNFKRKRNNKKLVPFEYKDKGSMATIGRNKAVVDLKFYRFAGINAWLVWMFIHLMALVGFRNKVVTFFNWTYAYINYDKGTRLIVRPFSRKKAREAVV